VLAKSGLLSRSSSPALLRHFAYRQHEYNYLGENRYRHPVVSVAVYGDDDPTWRPTEKITVDFIASREDQDYVAIQSVLGLLAPPRFDRVTAEQINVFYVPRERWTLNLFLRHERRSSNQANFAFSDNWGNVSFTYKFW